MVRIFNLLLLIGLLPLAAGFGLLKPIAHGERAQLTRSSASALLCALAFNLTFFWQELWLVVPKALTPGLHPILYHNDHDWTGSSPLTELLQGTGALATMISGLAFLGGLHVSRNLSATWRLFLFWMAFQGIYQSLTQVAFGAVLPGNDVGRALGYLHFTSFAKAVLLASTVAVMAVMGGVLARAYPSPVDHEAGVRTRAFLFEMAVPAAAAIVLIIPFRLPRNMIEVGLIPLAVNLIGIGWLTLGAAVVHPQPHMAVSGPPRVGLPAAMLIGLLLLFQLALRPGVAF